MVTALQVVAVFHVFFGVLWVGTSIYTDLVWIRPWRSTNTVAEVRLWQRILRPTGPFIGISAILVIATGLIYMFMKYQTDFGVIWANSSGRLILISLGIVIVAFLIGALGTNRLTIQLTRLSLPEDGNAPIPDRAKELMEGIMRVSALATTLIVIVLILMVLAATG